MNFCSHCGSSRIKLEVPPNDNRMRYCCPDCGTIHYQNPKMVTGCLATYENKVLLCKRAIEPAVGLWNLPAGYLENGESVEQGALRETMEEANAQAEIKRLFCVYNIPKINQVYLLFLAKLKSPEISCGPESLEVKLFEENEIPWDHIAFTSSQYALEKFFTSDNKDKRVHIGNYRTESEA